MVMHARKFPRLGDGYFEKNQSHSFEGANKYPRPGDRSNEKLRENFGSNPESSGRNDSIENRNSPRYHKSYSQRLKEKDTHEDVSSKSPAMKSETRANKDSQHKSSLELEGSSGTYQSNHDRNNSEESERRLQSGDWSEHISSSGKKYYYNCKTEVSQWEKPKELIELERQQSLPRVPHDANRARDRLHERQTSASSSKSSHSQDTNVSPENSESYNTHQNSGSHKNSYLQHPATTSAQQSQMQTHLLSPSQVTLSNLPKLISQLAGTKGLPNLSELSPQEALRTIQQALQLTKQVTNLSNVPDMNVQKSPAHSQNQILTSNHHLSGGATGIQALTNSSSSASASHVTVNNTSISACSLSHPLQDDKCEADRASPGSDCSTHSSRHNSPTSSISSLHSLNNAGTCSLASAVLKPSVPSLTPSLANYYREDLISHAVGWPADQADAQANRLWEEGYSIGSLNCTQVSAELKMARALVRLAEIQATLQEQRILFLRQQTKELEDWRSVNSFMSDS